MNKGKNEINGFHLKKQGKKVFSLLGIILILSFIVGGTLAYIAVSTNQVTNQFEAAYVSCRVNVKNDGKIDITNTGNVDAYIRATFIANWMDESGNVYGQSPVQGTQKGDNDYYITPQGTDWSYNADTGYYYYVKRIAPNGTTPNLVADVYVAPGKAPNGYKLSVEVVAEAIQADGVTVRDGSTIQAYTDAWGVSNIFAN